LEVVAVGWIYEEQMAGNEAVCLCRVAVGLYGDELIVAVAINRLRERSVGDTEVSEVMMRLGLLIDNLGK
jgi:hypothetical protein